MEIKKKYTAKIYSKAGVYKGVIEDVSSPRFTSITNGGLGQMPLTIPKTFDDYDAISLLDRVEVWVQDKDTAGTTGVKIYSGYIDTIDAELSSGNQNVNVSVLGYFTRLTYTLDMTGTTVKMDRLSQDPAVSVKDVIDKYRVTASNPEINYTASSVETAGFPISFSAAMRTCYETIEKFRVMTGANWWWFVDATNTFWFKSKPATPTHKFKLGKDISDIKITKKVGNMVNNFLFWNGLQKDDVNIQAKLFHSPSSVAAYWEKFDRLTDGRVTDGDYADKLGDATVDAMNAPSVELSFVVKDNNYSENGYDIESIQPGQTCRIMNIKDSSVYSGNLLITKTEYSPESIKVYVESSNEITGRNLSDIRTALDDTIYSDGVDTITLVDTD